MSSHVEPSCASFSRRLVQDRLRTAAISRFLKDHRCSFEAQVSGTLGRNQKRCELLRLARVAFHDLPEATKMLYLHRVGDTSALAPLDDGRTNGCGSEAVQGQCRSPAHSESTPDTRRRLKRKVPAEFLSVPSKPEESVGAVLVQTTGRVEELGCGGNSVPRASQLGGASATATPVEGRGVGMSSTASGSHLRKTLTSFLPTWRTHLGDTVAFELLAFCSRFLDRFGHLDKLQCPAPAPRDTLVVQAAVLASIAVKQTQTEGDVSIKALWASMADLRLHSRIRDLEIRLVNEWGKCDTCGDCL